MRSAVALYRLCDRQVVNLIQNKMAPSDKSMCPTETGFKVIPVKFKENNKHCHYIHYKLHQIRDSEKQLENTLFLLNIPPYCEESCLKRLFSQCGNVTNVRFHEKPTSTFPNPDSSKYFPQTPRFRGFKVGYVTFETGVGVEKALQLKITDPFVLSTKTNPITVGIKKWYKEYTAVFPDVSSLQAELEEYMTAYDEKQMEEKEAEKNKGDEPDDEGWVTVRARGKKKGIARTEYNLEKITKRAKKKSENMKKLNFYAYQIRETKMQHNIQLQKKFEEDKKRVAAAKAARSFKPY